MAQQDFVKLSAQGRSFDASRAWSEQELEALLALETGAGISRLEAAECIRNGITTVEMYAKAMEIGLEVKSLEQVSQEAIAAHQAEVRAQLGLDSDDDTKVETDEEKAEREAIEKAEADAKAELDALLALTREELEAEATVLGVAFRANSKNETIANNILEARVEASNKK